MQNCSKYGAAIYIIAQTHLQTCTVSDTSDPWGRDSSAFTACPWLSPLRQNAERVFIKPCRHPNQPNDIPSCHRLCCCCAVTNLLWGLRGTISSIIASAFQLLTEGIFQKVPGKSFRVPPETLNLGVLLRAK